MNTLNYPRHFFLLGGDSVALVLLLQLPTALPYDRLPYILLDPTAENARRVLAALREF